MLRGIWGDPQRYRDTYWARFDGKYFAGDGAKRDDEGYFWLLGRVDDIMLVSGHNISTTEVESALVDHPAVAEAAVVGKADDTTGQAIAAFVTLRGGVEPRDELVEELRDHVAELIGPIAKPKTILFTEELPKTRSGKIMRRLLRDVAEDQALGDTTTLADPTVVDGIKSRYLAASAGRGLNARCSYLPRALDLARRAGRARSPPSSSTSTACSPTRRAASTTSSRRARTGARSSTRAARTRSSRRCKTVLDLLDPDAPDRAAHRPPAPGPPPHRGVAAPLRDPLGPADHAAVGRLRAGPRLQAARRCGSCARPASSSGSPSRTTAATWRCSGPRAFPCLYVHSGYYD